MNRHCKWCGDEFDPRATARRLTHGHLVFRRPMCSADGRVHRISGNLCCFCRNIEKAHVPDEFRDGIDVVTEFSGTYTYPIGNMRLIVKTPGQGVWAREVTN